MNFLKRQIIILLVLASALFSGDRKVLLEMFTNAHCYSCVAAYELFRQFRTLSPNATKLSYILYHVTQPGVEDSIYFANREESDQRNKYYGSYNAAPLLFIDGTFVGSNTKTWQQYIDSKFPAVSPYSISLKGVEVNNRFTVDALITRNGAVADTDLRLHMILTESVSSYIGKNGVSPQIYAMRKMLTGPSGESFSLSDGGTVTVSRSLDLKPDWDKEKLWVTVFIQSASKKTVYQSEMISTTFFPVTSVASSSSAPKDLVLLQNYPNPFNPSTTIEFTLPAAQFVTLSVFNLLGNEVSSLVRETLPAGSHSVPFDASLLSSGLYFYRIQTNGTLLSRKMLLLR